MFDVIGFASFSMFFKSKQIVTLSRIVPEARNDRNVKKVYSVFLENNSSGAVLL